MSAKFNRRKLAAALAPAVLGSVLPAQPPASSTAESTADPAEELRLARERIRNNAGVLAKVKLAMATEPAFQFKA
ncbi:MAG: hypothetical protein ABSH56_26480 [Bryobacteraceae bacterium]|jgi:hypothetical protein